MSTHGCISYSTWDYLIADTTYISFYTILNMYGSVHKQRNYMLMNLSWKTITWDGIDVSDNIHV